MMIKKIAIVIGVLGCLSTGYSQKDRGALIPTKNGFLDTIKAESKRFFDKPETVEKSFKMDFSNVHAPAIGDFTQFRHMPPISQGVSGMCWCFSTTSFFESEVLRITNREIKISELYTVYWEYVEKARYFVKERGTSAFGEGSEANAVPRIWKKYGCVPADVYTGLKKGQKFHDHAKMFEEMKNYLSYLKTSGAWNEDEAVKTIRSIMNQWIGEPPESFVYNGKKMTPKDFLEKEVRLKMDDYVDVLSLQELPYYEMAEFPVPDNWWHSKEYYNVPLDEYMASLKQAVRQGFSVCIGGDVSEPGISGYASVAVVPSFDIASDAIDEYAREMRFNNGTTADDHGIHIVGYVEKDGKDWYLIKDSGSGVRNGTDPGYYKFHEDYVKLKMLGYTVHKDAVKDLLAKFRK
jgi:bleomycin hydrolase